MAIFLITWQQPDSMERRVSQFYAAEWLHETAVKQAFQERHPHAVVLSCRPLGGPCTCP
jgi:hypothetical protein